MTKQNIDAQRITKPIQLLAAWLIGLILVDGSFLGTALSIGPGWERTLLVVAAILNVPGFLEAIFLLQTRFRPELQEDVFYSEYISRKTNTVVEISRFDKIEGKISELYNRLSESTDNNKLVRIKHDSVNLDWSDWKIAININLTFYNELKASLNLSGIPVTADFGEGINNPLKSNIISISEEMPPEFALAVLKVAVNFPIEKFDFWSPIRDAGEDEDVYIGAYGPHSRAVTITQKVRAAILESQDGSDVAALAG